jgi:hypothetical protein
LPINDNPKLINGINYAEPTQPQPNQQTTPVSNRTWSMYNYTNPASTPFTNYQAGFSIPKDPKNISSFSSANYYQSSNPFSNSINPPQRTINIT